VSSSEPPRSPDSGESGGSATPSEPPPPPPPLQAAWSDPPPPPLPPGAGALAPDGPGTAEPPRRRGLVLGIAAAVLVIAVPVVLAVVAAVSAPETDAPDQTATDEEEDSTSEPDPVPPDLESLSGRDAILARLLSEVDESERAMIAFQDRLQEVMRDPDGEPEGRLAEVQAAAEEGADALGEVRSELVRPVEDQSFEEVRLAYLSHHDAWADYLDALAEDPTILLTEAAGSRWLVSINLSAEVFARELREAVDDDLETSVQAYARDILARGFEQPDRTPDA
jgi:hypothetical protein